MLRVRAHDGKVVEVAFETTETIKDLSNRIGRDILHYHGDFALKSGDKTFRQGEESGEVEEFMDLVNGEEVIFDLVNAGA